MSRDLNPGQCTPSLAAVIRALDTLSFGLCLLGWLLLGIFGTWKETAPFWIGAPLLWAAALSGLFTLHWGLRGRLSRSCTVSMLVFTVYIVWRALTSDVDYLARQDVVFAATAFIGWVLTAARYEFPWQRFALITVWSVLIVANLGMGLYQSFVEKTANPLTFLGFTRDYADAVFGGFFPNSNHLCGFMELAGFIALALAVFGRVHSFVRVVCGLVFVAAAVCVAMSTSRGGWVAFAVGVLTFGALSGVLVILRKRRTRGRWQVTGGLLVGMAVLCGIIGWLSLSWGQLESKFGTGNVFHNMNKRSEMWERAYEQWQEAPMVGTGARSYEYYERSYRNMETKWITWNDTDIDAIFAHNDWVQLLADYGIVGLLLAAALLSIHCWKALSFLHADSHSAAQTGGRLFTDHRGAIVMGAFCGIIAFAIHCVADFHMHVGVLAVLAASLLGIMANPGQPSADAAALRDDAVPRRGWKITAALPAAVLSAMLGWCFLPWAMGDWIYYKGLGDFNRAGNDIEEYFLASATMQRATEADPGNYDAWTYWALADSACADLLSGDQSIQLKFLTKALDRFKTAHQLYPQNPYISMYIGRTLDRLRRSEEAEQWFRKAIAWGDGARIVHHYYGDHLMAMRQYKDAREHYYAALHRYEYKDWQRADLDKKLQNCDRMLQKQHDAKIPVAPPNP